MTPKRTLTVLTAVGVSLLLTTVYLPAQQRIPPFQPLAQRGKLPNSFGVMQPANLDNLGAFKFPTIPGDSFVPGGPVVYNPVRDTLLVVTFSQRVVEITIPAPVFTESQAALPTATLVAGPVDVLQGARSLVDGDPSNAALIYGLFIDDFGRLIVGVTRFYDGDGSQQRSHFITGTDLNNLPPVQGPFQVGNTFGSAAGFAGGYMASIPAAWRPHFGGLPAVTGQCCLSILFRTSAGPSFSEFDPAHLGVLEPVPARPRIAYPIGQTTIGTYESQWGTPGVFYHMTTDIVGIAMIERHRTIAFVGRTGVGSNCYGSGEACGDPFDPDQGAHAAPYQTGLWLYSLDSVTSADQYAKPVPYAYLHMPLVRSGGRNTLTGAWFDPGTERLFVLSKSGDGNGVDRFYGLVHVIQIK